MSELSYVGVSLVSCCCLLTARFRPEFSRLVEPQLDAMQPGRIYLLPEALNPWPHRDVGSEGTDDQRRRIGSHQKLCKSMWKRRAHSAPVDAVCEDHHVECRGRLCSDPQDIRSLCEVEATRFDSLAAAVAGCIHDHVLEQNLCLISRNDKGSTCCSHQ